MKILHTSDWHLGRLLYKQKRYVEFEQFLSWLAETIETEQIDALLIAGDVFDSTTPGNRALELYYSFLGRVARSGCRHIVVTAGNHDSAYVLNAPRNVLRFLNIHIVGCASDRPEDEILLLQRDDGTPELIVCAVPYLRDSDVRTSEPGETADRKIQKTADGIRAHYALIAQKAEALRDELSTRVPIVAMGHLFAIGGETMKDDGVRDICVGTLGNVSADVFAPCFEYVALGHLHVPQRVNQLETRRYSGSPLPMGFGEAEQQKCVIIVETGEQPALVRVVPIPRFQNMKQVQGDLKSILKTLKELTTTDTEYWLEISYTGTDCTGSLQEHIDAAVLNTKLTVLSLMDERRKQSILAGLEQNVSLDELTEEDIFRRVLGSFGTPEEERPELLATFREALASVQHPMEEELSRDASQTII